MASVRKIIREDEWRFTEGKPAEQNGEGIDTRTGHDRSNSGVDRVRVVIDICVAYRFICLVILVVQNRRQISPVPDTRFSNMVATSTGKRREERNSNRTRGTTSLVDWRFAGTM